MLTQFTENDILKLRYYIRLFRNPNKPLVLWIDLFCGCGGVTEGYSKVENNFVVACVNHDPYAIKSHHANHPCCIHYVEDIRDWVVIHKIENLIIQLKKAFPSAIVGLHASLECTHISKAKGGQSRKADSRTLSFHLEKYMDINPDYITIENVEEILTNGPVDEEEKVIKELKGIDYLLWVEMIQDYGYDYQYKVLNAADYGEYTSRKRYFGTFAKKGLPISYPKPTHVSRKKHHLFPNLELHKPVRDKLNLENEGRSLFGLNLNGKEYVDKTFARVLGGCLKFHKEGYFTIRYNGGKASTLSKSITEPLGTILTNNTHGLVKPIFLTSYYGQSQDGNGVHDLDSPCNTLTTKDRFALHHIQYAYGKPTYTKIDEPAQTITTNAKHELVSTHWLFDAQFQNKGSSIEKPCPTIIASQDKKPLMMATASTISQVDNSIDQPGDSEVKLKLRKFMRENGITDIKIRSLELEELLRIQGFPEDYILLGGKTRSLKYIGNSVVPGMAEALANTLYEGIKEHFKIAA